MEDRSIFEKIDACRPGSDDHRLADMAPLAERLDNDPALEAVYSCVQRMDSRIGRAFEDIPVPSGLRERILAKLALPGAATQPLAAPEMRTPSIGRLALPTVVAIGGGPRTFPRRYSRALAAVAAALLLAVGGWVLWPALSSFSRDRLLELSGQWHTDLGASAGWQHLAKRQMVDGFPVADAVRAPAVRWLDATEIVGHSAVAYDLTDAGGHRATLFVIPQKEPIADSAPTTPHSLPDSTTGGLMIGCWQSHGMVYVLVVEGDERRYQSLLERSGPQPLA